ncbi:MAG: hypothetical protein P8J37_22510 [Fuerstiella sp.]|nr:hypothetical protein [Fuerstiella sp.]
MQTTIDGVPDAVDCIVSVATPRKFACLGIVLRFLYHGVCGVATVSLTTGPVDAPFRLWVKTLFLSGESILMMVDGSPL